MFTGLSIKLIIGAVILAITFGSGWKVRDAFCDAAAEKLKVANLTAQIAILNKRISTAADLAAADKVQAAIDAKLLEQLQKQIDETPKNEGVCLDEGATGRIGGVK